MSDVLVWRSLAEVPGDLGPTTVVVGNFDGVHRGHRTVIARARAEADARRTPLVAVTFAPHPMAVLRPDHAPSQLTDIPHRVELLAAAGIDAVLVLPFDLATAAWSPQEFVERVLVAGLAVRAVVVGANFRFGHRAAGDVALLARLGAESGRDFVAIGVELDGGPQVWSSTYIRTCVATGDVSGAAEALGRPYAVTGVVVEGDKRGRELGYPTANVPVGPHDAVPADGVYAGWLRRLDGADGDVRHPVAISVGTNPTFAGERDRRVESYVLDRTDLELYGVEVEVTFVARIRGMLTFASIDELIVAMRDDVEKVRGLLR